MMMGIVAILYNKENLASAKFGQAIALVALILRTLNFLLRRFTSYVEKFILS